ncbi:MAG TPA: hypothetical protein VHD32_19190 [Candidatus Didemnitutus sp.]|nr:hypothetical protein [Candidatus Didemnitutus sp.]
MNPFGTISGEFGISHLSRLGIAASISLIALLAGCATAQVKISARASTARFYLEAGPHEAGKSVVLPISGVALNVQPAPVLIESDVAHVAFAHVELGDCLLVRFKSPAARDLFRLSLAAPGRRLVMVVDDKPLGARRIDVPLPEGDLLIFAEVPPDRLPELVAQLQRGIDRLTQAPVVAQGT